MRWYSFYSCPAENTNQTTSCISCHWHNQVRIPKKYSIIKHSIIPVSPFTAYSIQKAQQWRQYSPYDLFFLLVCHPTPIAAFLFTQLLLPTHFPAPLPLVHKALTSPFPAKALLIQCPCPERRLIETGFAARTTSFSSCPNVRSASKTDCKELLLRPSLNFYVLCHDTVLGDPVVQRTTPALLYPKIVLWFGHWSCLDCKEKCELPHTECWALVLLWLSQLDFNLSVAGTPQCVWVLQAVFEKNQTRETFWWKTPSHDNLWFSQRTKSWGSEYFAALTRDKAAVQVLPCVVRQLWSSQWGSLGHHSVGNSSYFSSYIQYR